MAGNDDNLQLRDAPHDHQIYHNEQVLPAVGGQHGNDRPNIQQPAAAARQPGVQQELPRMTLAQYDTPDAFYVNRSGINPPPIERREFEIKTGLINLVQQKQFHGLPLRTRCIT